ncbi:uncharacterized protein TrAFT101_010188 [Trichoderma asperellum]|uniref:uncharacterized protein n=1 Tax=Trichoderma asperellum TaxID=101201 RepID=UPI003319A3BB|nr:hypothetical protein TrAFT101_010188 [Trichoderma asperellum]
MENSLESSFFIERIIIMSNRGPPLPLDISAAKSWIPDAPDHFARRIEPVSPNLRKSRKNVTPESSIKWDQHTSPVAAKEAVLEAVGDDKSNSVTRAAKIPEIKDNNEAPVDGDVFTIGEQSPRIEAKDISPCVSDFGVEAADGGERRSAFDELSGANFWNDSDSGSERNALVCGNDTEADAVYASKSMASDSVDDFTGDSGCDVANFMVESITARNKDQYQSREPNTTHGDCRECMNMKEEIIQERVLMEEEMFQQRMLMEERIERERTHMEEQIEQERVHMEEQMAQKRTEMEEQIDQERIRMGEKLASLEKTIAELETQSIALTDKAAAYADACMNTETHEGQEADMNSPASLPSPSQLGLSPATSHPTPTLVARILGACLALSYECQSTSPMQIPYLFTEFIKSTFFRLVTPLCCLGNLVLLLQAYREKEIWMQANSSTRKHLLEQPGSESSIWGVLVIIGSLAVIS